MVTIQEIKKLRDHTGASVTECKKALEASSGSIKKAIEMLQKRGSKIADKKCGRNMSEGFIGSYIHNNGKIGALVEISCETDFVARSDEFRMFAHDLAMHIVASNPEYVDYDKISQEAIKSKKEEILKEARKENKPQEIVNKIAEGRVKKYFDGICLLTQPFVKDPDRTVNDLVVEKIAKIGENIKVNRFVRFEM